MTENELNEIEERANAATPGKWDYVLSAFINKDAKDDQPYGVRPRGADFYWGYDSKEDANFIAHAREDIPALIAEVRQLRAEREVLIVQRNALSRVINYCPDAEYGCVREILHWADCSHDNAVCWLEWARSKAEKAEQT